MHQFSSALQLLWYVAAIFMELIVRILSINGTFHDIINVEVLEKLRRIRQSMQNWVLENA